MECYYSLVGMTGPQSYGQIGAKIVAKKPLLEITRRINHYTHQIALGMIKPSVLPGTQDGRINIASLS